MAMDPGRFLEKPISAGREKATTLSSLTSFLRQKILRTDTKEVIVTDLWNYAWPLIRYKIGDLIAGEFGKCDCGCTWKTFDTIVGRVSELFILPNGGLMHAMFWAISDLWQHMPSMKLFQFAKVDENKFEFRLQLYEGQDAAFVNDLREVLSHHFKGISDFDIKVVEGFPIGPSGKHKSVVDETT